MVQNEHGKLIAAAAKAALLPIGCVRKGQSRLWYSDQRFWIISVEFQPSGWSKGSYLNISAGWLWSANAGSNLWYRPMDFIPFQDKEQFAPLVEEMARCAAREVIALRDRFNTLEKIQRYLLTDQRRGGGPLLNAAIASWLIGEIDISRELFQRIGRWPTDGYDWQKDLKAFSTRLNKSIDNTEKFRAVVLETIQHRRQANGLPPDPHCLDDALDSKGGP